MRQRGYTDGKGHALPGACPLCPRGPEPRDAAQTDDTGHFMSGAGQKWF